MLKLLIFIIVLGILISIGIGFPILMSFLLIIGIVILPILSIIGFYLLFEWFWNRGKIGIVIGIILSVIIVWLLFLEAVVNLNMVGKFFINLINNFLERIGV